MAPFYVNNDSNFQLVRVLASFNIISGLVRFDLHLPLRRGPLNIWHLASGGEMGSGCWSET